MNLEILEVLLTQLFYIGKKSEGIVCPDLSHSVKY